MGKKVDIFTSHLIPFFLMLFFPSVLSQLSANQTTIMTTLSNFLINNTASSWNPTKQPDPCSWKGVTCGPHNSSVIHLSLPGFGLSSSGFLVEVCKIGSLQSLDLSNNRFGSIPDGFLTGCGGIDGLKLLNFSGNMLVGDLPSFSVGFSVLESLDLSFNQLNGEVSSQLDGLVALKSLNLSMNKLKGPFPALKSMLLEELKLSVNFFQGMIPPGIGNFVELSMIDLCVNKFWGSIPDAIGNLTKLKLLILSENNLNGELPAAISGCKGLFRFAANQNQFGGRIPSGITRYLSFLDLSYNKLSGPIPADLLSPSHLQSVDLSYNSLNGSIPENVSGSLFRLRLGSNFLTGEIPSSFSGLRKLIYLELDNNSLSSVIPSGLGSCQNLSLLNLAQNRLTGSLPLPLGNLSNLQVLKLQFNELDGEIPLQITQLLKLSVLNISRNLLTGAIPSSISNLKSLSHLDLQGNKLNGSIPDTFKDMNSLLELQLGQNQLGEKIPELPPNLQIALNLSRNHFQGAIPSTLYQLQDLEVLDLSDNQFSGEIPEFLTRMNSLTQVDLSNNNLSGIIPSFKQFVLVITTGNPGLSNRTQTKTDTQPSKKKKSVAIAVILAVATSALVVGVVMAVVMACARRILRINDQQSQSAEDVPFPQVIAGNLLTTNVIHRTKIDFAAAMEAVADPVNIMLKTRFSTYYLAMMPSGTSYLVKKLNWSDKIFQCGNHDKFEQELEVLGRLSNSNVMTPLAYVLTVDSAYLLYEHAPKGTLFDVLHCHLGDSLDWSSRYSIAVGVAQGLAFLHGCNSSPILLFDLSSRNILLKSLKEPLVGDIELCKVIDPTKNTGSLSTVAGSVGYIPPEYAYTMRVTMAGNVYSFGVVLLELLTGKPAVSEGTELAKWVLSNSMQQDKLDQMLDSNISRTSLATKSQMLAVLKVALSCVSISPEGRPKMKSVLRMILNVR